MRIVFSNDGLIFVTYDHYQTFCEIKIVFHPKTKGSEKLRSAVESVIHVFREAEIAYHEICLEVDNQ